MSLQSGRVFKLPQTVWRYVYGGENATEINVLFFWLEFNGRGHSARMVGFCILIACLWALLSELRSHVNATKTCSPRLCLDLNIIGREMIDVMSEF